MDSYTVLRVKGGRSAPIVCGRVVRQDDPFSTFLFNCVMDEVLAVLGKAIEFELCDNLLVR